MGCLHSWYSSVLVTQLFPYPTGVIKVCMLAAIASQAQPLPPAITGLTNPTCLQQSPEFIFSVIMLMPTSVSKLTVVILKLISVYGYLFSPLCIC